MRIQMAMTVANNNTKANSGNVNSYASVVFNGIADIEAACAADDEMMAMVRWERNERGLSI